MALNGQASGDWTESSSNLRLLHVQVRNTQGQLTTDAFTQANPPIVTTLASVSAQLPGVPDVGVLSGSVAFTRPDAGNNFLGGPNEAGALGANGFRTRPLGLFLNTAVGNAFENTPGVASNRGPYVAGGGTMGSLLYETQVLRVAGAVVANATIVYTAGDRLAASRNGYLMPLFQGGGVLPLDLIAGADTANFSETQNMGIAGSATVLAILKNVPDATLDELVFDLRV